MFANKVSAMVGTLYTILTFFHQQQLDGQAEQNNQISSSCKKSHSDVIFCNNWVVSGENLQRYHSDNDKSVPMRDQGLLSERSPMIWAHGNDPKILLTLRTCHVPHQHGCVRLQVSDKKLINYTTEMILWSIILPAIVMLQLFTQESQQMLLPAAFCFNCHHWKPWRYFPNKSVVPNTRFQPPNETNRCRKLTLQTLIRCALVEKTWTT